MNGELKPCPFCGGEIKLDEDDFYMFCCDERIKKNMSIIK